MHAKQGFGICHSRVLSSKAETECLEQMRTTPRTQESAIAPTLFPKPQAFWKVWKLIGDAKAEGGVPLPLPLRHGDSQPSYHCDP